MATYNSIDEAIKELDKQMANFKKDSYRIEGILFYQYDRDIREVTPIDTGRTRRYPHTQRAMLEKHTLEWSPKSATSQGYKPYVGEIYNNNRKKFRHPAAINEWDIRTAEKNNTKYASDFNSEVLRHFK